MQKRWQNLKLILPDYRAGVGELLTLKADEAKKVGYSEGTVASFNELLKITGLENADIISTNETFAESIARFVTHPVVVPILLSIAGLGFVLELYSPGFGVPGTMANFVGFILLRTSCCGACGLRNDYLVPYWGGSGRCGNLPAAWYSRGHWIARNYWKYYYGGRQSDVYGDFCPYRGCYRCYRDGDYYEIFR